MVDLRQRESLATSGVWEAAAMHEMKIVSHAFKNPGKWFDHVGDLPRDREFYTGHILISVDGSDDDLPKGRWQTLINSLYIVKIFIGE